MKVGFMKYRVIFSILMVWIIQTIGYSKNYGSQNENPKVIDLKVSLEATLNEKFENTLYPSLIYSLAGMKDENGNFQKLDYFQLKVTSNKAFEAKICITNDKFIRETILNRTIEIGENEISGIDPLWKFDDFVNFTIPGYTFFKFEIIDNKTDKVLAHNDMRLSYRSINECVRAYYEEGSWEITDDLFAAYVNEDAPEIETILQKISQRAIAGGLNFRGWSPNSTDEEALMQLLYVTLYFANQGYIYSNITDTSNANTKIASQQVRFIKNTITNKQANCVDGSVLLASIFKKIGFKTALVVHPGHMYCGIVLPNSQAPIFVETTLIQYLRDVAPSQLMNVFKQIVTGELQKDKSVTTIVDIDEAREAGIKPIQ